jgi:ABC-type transport system involved in multi-copper enzyme maturation permease subunit
MISPLRVWAIGTNTVREAIRNKLLYTLLFFAIVLIGTGVIVSSISYVESGRILQDVGLASIRLFSVGIAIFVGVGLIHGEVHQRTIYTILSKPVSRAEFLVGKYVGLLLTVWLQLAIMTVAFLVVSGMAGDGERELHVGLELEDLVEGEYVYVRIVQIDRALAWSSPIFVE